MGSAKVIKCLKRKKQLKFRQINVHMDKVDKLINQTKSTAQWSIENSFIRRVRVQDYLRVNLKALVTGFTSALAINVLLVT